MAGTTSVPSIQFTPAGLITPDESAIKAGVFADMNAAFGGNLNPSDSTPQGQLVASSTALIGEKNDDFLSFMNGIDPATSSGTMQDGIGKLYRLTRLPARATTVNVVCSGKTNTNIAVGALVIDVSGNVYTCTQAGVIPPTGSITLQFQAQVTGPIACPAGAIPLVGGIYKTILGWDSATNITDGVIGADLESRVDFEFRRQQSVAANARDTLTAVQAEVINVTGVTDAYVTTNRTSSPVVIDGFTLSPHSVYVAAVGGADQDIGDAIWRKVSVGADFNGNTSVTVTDNGDYNIPKPTYTVKFNRNDELPIFFAVTVQNLTSTPNATVATAIRNAIVAAFFGADGGTRARIGSTILATRYIVPIAGAAQVALLSVFIGTAVNPVGLSVAVQIDQYPSIDPNDIAVNFV
jgi:hypothetical protein